MRTKINCHRILLLFPLFYLLWLSSPIINAQTYGLKFKGHEVTLDNRTELDLTPDGFIKFKDEFEISFDYKTTRIKPGLNNSFFGYVFRIVNAEDNNIDLLSTPTPNIGLNIVIGKSNSIIPIDYSLENINNWIKLRVKFMLTEDRLIFYTPDTFYVMENVGFKKQESFKIMFGASDYKQFKNSDVPSMTIKNIEISEQGKLKYRWLLDEKAGNIATDNIRGKKSKVKNPIWLVNNYQNWELNFKDDISGQLAFASDADNGRIFIIGLEEFYIYSVLENNIKTIKYKQKPHFLTNSCRTVYSSLDNRIYCYQIDLGLYSLDINTGEWNETGSTQIIENNYRHHNSYFNVSDNSIFVFGGYGLHSYKDIIKRLDVENHTWENLPTDSTVFLPRYLAGLGSLNDTLYIFGGYGSRTGNQLINPQSYFDMFGYSIKDGSLFKKFEIQHLIDDMIVGNTMWINEKNRNYYALIFSKSKFNGDLQLLKGNLNSPDVEMVGSKIPFKFLDIRSTANLYYMPVSNKLYTLTSYNSDSITQVAIYSITNPPNETQFNAIKSIANKNLVYLYIAIALLLFSGVIVYLRKRKVKTESHRLDKTRGLDESVEISTDERINYNVIFFGGFQVFDKNLVDITNKFSPLLKELFLLILLYTFKNNKGISSDKITEVLWYDKSEKSARNNRAVNMAKLRGIFEEVGSCELTKKTGYWKIVFDNCDIKSDYVDFLSIVGSKNNLTKQKVNRLIDITQKGAFLSNLHYEWLDDFKASVSDNIVDTLVGYAQSRNVKEESDFIIHLADSILNFDIVNEDAMILKSRAQYCMGKHSLAKATYEKFFKEYVTMYGQEYEQSLIDILDIKE